MQDREKEIEKEKAVIKTRCQKLESKLQKKKERIRSLINEMQDKEQQFEQQKSEVPKLKEKIKALN